MLDKRRQETHKMDPHFPTKQETAVRHLKGDKMEKTLSYKPGNCISPRKEHYGQRFSRTGC